MAYLLFAGHDYYPEGGAFDLKGRFDSLELAIAAHDPSELEIEGGWANVLCLDSLKLVRIFRRGQWYEQNHVNGHLCPL